MLVFSVLAFSIVSFFVSFMIGRKSDMDKGQAATYISLVSWGSLICGLSIAKFIL